MSEATSYSGGKFLRDVVKFAKHKKNPQGQQASGAVPQTASRPLVPVTVAVDRDAGDIREVWKSGCGSDPLLFCFKWNFAQMLPSCMPHDRL